MTGGLCRRRLGGIGRGVDHQTQRKDPGKRGQLMGIKREMGGGDGGGGGPLSLSSLHLQLPF